MGKNLRRIAASGAVLILGFALARAWSTGPPDGMTGAPGESTCAQSSCHDLQPAMTNLSYFKVSAGDAIGHVFPGDTNLIVVGFTSGAGGSRWGFELTALDQNEQPAGTLLADSPLTQLSTAGDGRQYAKQTESGTGQYAWTVKWLAGSDPTVTSVTFYATGCWANGDGFQSGDFVYKATAKVYPWYGDCRVILTGDANYNASITSADIITLVSYIFKGGPEPRPCPAAGDVTCDGAVTTSDIILLVNFVFKRGGRPCDVCTIVPELWSCP